MRHASQVDIPEGEPDRPLAPKPCRISVKVTIDGIVAGELEGERLSDLEAREVAREILAQAESLLRGMTYAH